MGFDLVAQSLNNRVACLNSFRRESRLRINAFCHQNEQKSKTKIKRCLFNDNKFGLKLKKDKYYQRSLL